ncbi:carotenoid 1,2-hydratase [Comamonas sp. NLF-1-9]|uniref:lipocalin-like domain-containing protein n=1 Tax=Comamonas sp. NLF-1-9 TaxID=2853163 RepID=UPI001C472134|nr:carotenoid 1,2-hydratase [Comamonas sp. NLF-1-9]QXL84691.1 carotenoid 1,2-hydratase [Comamonas sp. NLF-1-9]
MRRRQMLRGLGALGLPGFNAAAWALPVRTLRFPRDHGSHPELRTEWWYITGQARTAEGLWGFQITFFRSRVDAAQSLQSRFAARQLLFAHAAVTDLRRGRLLHDQRVARAGWGVAEASSTDCAIRLQDWSLTRTPHGGPGDSRYAIRAGAADFALEIDASSTQAPLLQGDAGLSRKGPHPDEASYYVSQPQLQLAGALSVAGQRMPLTSGEAWDNRAWMDHEWSETLLAPDAVGWDWIGMNLRGGGALTAFQLRRADGSALWAGGSLRPSGDAPVQVFGSDEVRFTAQGHWRSALSGARYPVRWRLQTPAGNYGITALLDDQELDSRASTGAIYWEGLSTLRDEADREIGRGYLEMTGYAQPLQLR